MYFDHQGCEFLLVSRFVLIEFDDPPLQDREKRIQAVIV